MKIYTKSGDRGETMLIGGTKVPKYNDRIEAYGTVDELNSFVGLVRDVVEDPAIRSVLYEIQDRLFVIGSRLATDPSRNSMALPELHQEDILMLEREIDRMNEVLPELRHFILPGGHLYASYAHVCRTIARRAERHCVHLNQTTPFDELILPFINRLSDYFFVLARMLAHAQQAEEVTWHPDRHRAGRPE
jgi:cob(I)alamin adenosyltransferase